MTAFERTKKASELFNKLENDEIEIAEYFEKMFNLQKSYYEEVISAISGTEAPFMLFILERYTKMLGEIVKKEELLTAFKSTLDEVYSEKIKVVSMPNLFDLMGGSENDNS